MRILFAVSPGLGHLFPAVTTAWALRAAGHDVLMATAEDAGYAARAGLHAFNVAPGLNPGALIAGFKAQHPDAAALARDADPVSGARFAGLLFARLSEAMVDGTVALADAWQPDLVLYTSLQGTGPLVAARLGVPAVEHGVILARNQLMVETLRAGMAGAYARHGVTEDPPSTEFLDVVPTSMGNGECGLAMRYLPYNGATVLPDWLLREPERPRIAVTLGTVVPLFGGLGPLSHVVEAAREVDAEFVLATGDADPAALGTLPDNVRPAGWVPLGALLATCAALVHHGGSGTTFTALAAGVPQLVTPYGADHFHNARAMTERGVGLTTEPDKVDAEPIRRLLSETGFESAAAEVAAEIAALPTPVDLVPHIVSIAR